MSRFGTVAVNGQAAWIAKLLDGGYLELMTGDPPESVDDSVPEDLLLARCQFAAVAFSVPKNGVILANPIGKTVAIRQGEPKWCRCVTKDGLVVMDGSIGESGANLITAVDTIVKGQIVNITKFQHIVSKQGV